MEESTAYGVRTRHTEDTEYIHTDMSVAYGALEGRNHDGTTPFNSFSEGSRVLNSSSEHRSCSPIYSYLPVKSDTLVSWYGD